MWLSLYSSYGICISHMEVQTMLFVSHLQLPLSCSYAIQVRQLMRTNGISSKEKEQLWTVGLGECYRLT